MCNSVPYSMQNVMVASNSACAEVDKIAFLLKDIIILFYVENIRGDGIISLAHTAASRFKWLLCVLYGIRITACLDRSSCSAITGT